MTIYVTVNGVSQLLDESQWEASVLAEQVITLSPAVRSWIDIQIGRTTPFTETELIAEPIVTLAANSYCVYSLLSTQLDGHRVEEYSLALRRLEDAKDYIRAYCFRHGVTPVFDAIDTEIPGTVDFAFAAGTDAGCI